MNWHKLLNWHKLKRVIIPLLIIKIVVFVVFIFKSEYISISREITYNGNYQQETEGDTLIQKRQKVIRIVKNEEDRGITIKLRGKKNTKSIPDTKRELYNPKVEF